MHQNEQSDCEISFVCLHIYECILVASVNAHHHKYRWHTLPRSLA